MSAVFADVELIAPDPGIVSLVRQRITTASIAEFNRDTWPGLFPQNWNFASPRDTSEGIAFNELFWPQGASRWAVGHWIVDSLQLQQIRQTTNRAHVSVPAAFEFDHGTHSLSTMLWMLPPRPLFQCMGEPVTSIPNGDNLYLLTLVDARYYWDETPATITITGGVTTWASLYAAIGSALGVTIQADTIPSAYLFPPEDFSSRYQSLPMLLDAVALSVGQRIVRRLDGTVIAQNADTAIRSVRNQGLPTDRQGGGVFCLPMGPSDDRPFLVPASVQLTFPKSAAGVVSRTESYPVVTSLASLKIVEYGPTVGYGTQIIDDNALAYVAVGGTDPANLAELQALTVQWSADWYRWQLARLDVNFDGIVPWVMDGFHDVTFSYDDDGTQNIFTRLTRAPWNDTATRIGHWGTYGAENYAWDGDKVARTVTDHGDLMTVSETTTVTGNVAALSTSKALVRLSPNAPWTIYGIGSPVDGKHKWLWNTGTAPLTIAHQSVSATAVNRIILSNSADLTLSPNAGVRADYLLDDQRWRIAAPGTSSGGSGVSSLNGLTGSVTITGQTSSLATIGVTTSGQQIPISLTAINLNVLLPAGPGILAFQFGVGWQTVSSSSAGAFIYQYNGNGNYTFSGGDVPPGSGTGRNLLQGCLSYYDTSVTPPVWRYTGTFNGSGASPLTSTTSGSPALGSILASSGTTFGQAWATPTQWFDQTFGTLPGSMVSRGSTWGQLGPGTATQFLGMGGSPLVPTWSALPASTVYARKTGNQNGITAAVDVSDLGVAVASGQTIRFECYLRIDTSATIIGASVAVNGPTSTILAYTTREWTASATQITTGHVAYDDFAAISTSAGATERVYEIVGVAKFSASGTFTPRAQANGVAATMDVLAGSWIEYDLS